MSLPPFEKIGRPAVKGSLRQVSTRSDSEHATASGASPKRAKRSEAQDHGRAQVRERARRVHRLPERLVDDRVYLGGLGALVLGGSGPLAIAMDSSEGGGWPGPHGAHSKSSGRGATPSLPASP